MPSLNLRLSDELHAELVASAKAEHRSLQAEIVMRLEAHGALVGTVLARPSRLDDQPPAEVPERVVRPDFKK